MKTQEEIEERIKQIEADSRYQAPPALVFVNSPLALIQTDMKAEVRALRWVLEKLGL
jgi:hypothetical protein